MCDLSWVRGVACSGEFLLWYLFWQKEKTCCSSCCTWLSREHFWKWSVLCSEKACSNICINPNTTFKCEAIKLSILFFKNRTTFPAPLETGMRKPQRSHTMELSDDALCCREHRLVFYRLLSVVCLPSWSWTVMIQCPPPGAKDSLL